MKRNMTRTSVLRSLPTVRFSMMRYFDQETNEWVDKAIVVVDGKVLNPAGFVKILKGAKS